ncbi:MAG: Ca2+/Na+ antiporter [Myxococcota bacterium]|jgi:Ca2+/Na+ antiporter
MAILTMIVTAALIILAVKYGLLRGIDHIAGALTWSAKTRGQVTGFATSVPELVCLVAAGLAGVWEAGLWNIASSNIINGVLLLSAVAWFRQGGELFRRRFADEIGFALAAIALPIGLMQLGVDRHWAVIPTLFSFFLLYRFLDKRLNAPGTEGEPEAAEGSLPIGMTLAVTSLITIAIVGVFLGDATKDVVQQLGVHPALAGFILGVCTSIPELISFFAVYQTSAVGGRLSGLADTQEALDNLTSSNVSNVGVVYPAGLAAFLLVAPLLG